MASIESVKIIQFTSDIFKVDDRAADRSANPQKINIEWLHALFSPFIERILSLPSSLLTGEEPQHPLNRVNFYHRRKLSMSSSGWAAIYEDLGCNATREAIIEHFARSVVIGFEMPPYLIKLLDQADIPYIDLGIHPIRYLPDYVFGIRTNLADVNDRLRQTRIPESVFEDFARISSARTTRIMRGWRPVAGSAVFLGQIEVDASLLHNGKISSLSDIEADILSLVQSHSKLYYKYHPHRKERDSIERFLNAHPSISVAEVNVYDLLACPEIFLATSLSSGSLMEARHFGKQTRRFLTSFNPYEIGEGIQLGQTYLPAPQNIFAVDYWEYLFGRVAACTPIFPNPTDGALKFTLNQKWGR